MKRVELFFFFFMYSGPFFITRLEETDYRPDRLTFRYFTFPQMLSISLDLPSLSLSILPERLHSKGGGQPILIIFLIHLLYMSWLPIDRA